MQYHPVLISVALKYILKSGSVTPQTFLFLFSYLDYSKPFILPYSFKINFSISTQKEASQKFYWNFIEIHGNQFEEN